MSQLTRYETQTTVLVDSAIMLSIQLLPLLIFALSAQVMNYFAPIFSACDTKLFATFDILYSIFQFRVYFKNTHTHMVLSCCSNLITHFILLSTHLVLQWAIVHRLILKTASFPIPRTNETKTFNDNYNKRSSLVSFFLLSIRTPLKTTATKGSIRGKS